MPHTNSDEYKMMIDSLADKAYRAIVGYPELLPADSDNPYEMASTRFGAMMAADSIIRAVTNAILKRANDEYDAACENLHKYESQPGIPLPEYQWQAWENRDNCIHPGVFATGNITEHCDKCGRDIPMSAL
jgi:hypothetical protein